MYIPKNKLLKQLFQHTNKHVALLQVSIKRTVHANQG
jgi:hypothetical protein